jgi:hypothetical protein
MKTILQLMQAYSGGQAKSEKQYKDNIPIIIENNIKTNDCFNK